MIYDDLKHFRATELLSLDGLTLLKRGITAQSMDALIKLDNFRSHLNTEFNCNHNGLHLRGFRSPSENSTLYNGNNRYSFHFWCAFDITTPNLNIWDLFQAAIDFEWGGVYIYEVHNFVHMDNRAGTRWVAKKKDGLFQLVDLL